VHGGDIAILVNYAVLFVLVRRYARSRRDEERLHAELAAARAVQEVLIPKEVPSIADFTVETVYKPAAEVGGDFFQIIPLAAGGTIVAIGDVSGKGMPAAVTVSLIVGTLRTLADYTQSPGEILSALNRRMLARSHGGFTTCLVLRIDANSTFIAANAGHIAPYLDGQEIEIENGLSLGLAETAEYRETAIRLEHEGRLTLLTDGVVEARNSRGELLGFERTRELSTHPAKAVAEAAQSFGQEDDITVLSLCRLLPRWPTA
jgi:serine phosphatase RsbU (regulator of sigma subunit)